MHVVAYQPYRRLWVVAMAALLAVAVLLGGYLLGRAHANVGLERLAELEEERLEHLARLDELGHRLADFNLTESVDTQASESLRETIRDQRDETSSLREEVAFYKGLMAPSSLEKGLHIAEFALEAAHGPSARNQLAYELVLTQVAQRRSWIKGHVRVDFVGMRAGEEVVLSLTDLSDVETYPLAFRFRYFQDFSGRLTLPEGFELSSMVVTARRSNGKEFQRTFAWSGQEDPVGVSSIERIEHEGFKGTESG
jgi:hypothetical protein